MERGMPAIRFDVDRPATYEPTQLLVRLLAMIALAVIGAPLGWVFCVAYFGLPVLAAVYVSTPGGAERYHQRVAPVVIAGFRWLLGVYAFLGLLTDRVPLDARSRGIRYEVTPSGTPTVSSALAHLITSIPAAILLWLLGIASAVLWVIAAISILVRRSYPEWIWDFQRGVLRTFARFLAHQASLVPGPAPVAFDSGPEGGVTPEDDDQATLRA